MAREDGSIIIGTKLDTSKFDKQVNDLEKKMSREEKKEVVVGAKLANQEKELDAAKKKVEELARAYEKVKEVQDAIESRRATPEQFQDFFAMKNEYGSPENVKRDYDSAVAKQQALNQKVMQTQLQYDAINEKVTQYKNKIENIKVDKQKEAIDRVKDSINGIESGLGRAIKKVGKLVLGVFAIRSAFLAVRRASNDLASYNEKYAANLEYIRYALTQLLAPVLEYIVNLARTLLGYLNYILNAWFGINIFANASAKSFEKVKRGIGGASAAAKELKKTLTGFDEMNILNSPSTGGGGGVGGGFTAPDFDLSNWENIPIPEWVKWIANNKELVLGTLGAIAAALLTIKAIRFARDLMDIVDGFKKLGGALGAIKTLGIAAIIAGVVTAIVGLVNFIKDPSWENFRVILIGLTIAAAGLAVALLAVNATNPFGWAALAVGAVIGLAVAIGDAIKKEEKQITTEEKLRNATDKLIESKKKLRNLMKEYASAIDAAEAAERDLIDAEKAAGKTAEELIQKMETQNLTYKDLNETERELYKAYLDNKEAQSELIKTTGELNTTQSFQKDYLYQIIGALKESGASHDEYKKKITDAYNNGTISAQQATEAIGIALADMDADARKAFVQDLPNNIKKGLNPANYQKQANEFKTWWNRGFLGNLTSKIKLQIDAVAKTNGVKTGGIVTKMASGGIINMPNKGVPVTSAIAGEAGTEGILPLTDSQAMAELGKEIGKWITINANIPVNMNGRLISRELRSVQNEQDFAYNM